MSNRMFLAGGLVVGVCTAFVYVLATRDDAAKPQASERGPRAAPAKAPADDKAAEKSAKAEARPLFEGWEKPAAAIVLTSEMHGYIEPCGCSLHQLGGLPRRADLIRQMEERGWPVTALDAGGLVNNPTRKQAKLKLAMALRSLKEMKYAGVALGPEELDIGLELLVFGDSDRPPFLGSNVMFFGTAPAEPNSGGHELMRIVEVGAVRIGVTAVIGKSLAEAVRGTIGQNGQPPDIEILDPIDSLKKAVAALQAEKPDLMVLLAHSKFEEAKAYARAFPQFQVVVSAHGPEDPALKPTFHENGTLMVLPGQKGKHVCVLGFYPGKKEHRLRYEAVSLDEDRFRESTAIREQMRHYQEMLELQNLVAAEPAIEDPRNATIEEANEYVGAKVCGECHRKAYAAWKETPHAHATSSIKTGRAGQEADYISRIHDAECVACHVTGWDPKLFVRYNSGYVSERESAHLLGQQCENCHGPGGRHTELERQFAKDKNLTGDVTKFRKLAQLFVDEAAENQCAKCHDGDNDPNFNSKTFAEYWEKIKHPGKD